MVSSKEEVIDGSLDPALSLLPVLPDSPHVLKTLRASFSNWSLQLGSERGNLYLLYTLRNRAEPEVRKVIKKHLPPNDYVRNRDRQDPTAVLKLCNPEMCDYISNLAYVCHTIVPETVRFTATNERLRLETWFQRYEAFKQSFSSSAGVPLGMTEVSGEILQTEALLHLP